MAMGKGIVRGLVGLGWRKLFWNSLKYPAVIDFRLVPLKKLISPKFRNCSGTNKNKLSCIKVAWWGNNLPKLSNLLMMGSKKYMGIKINLRSLGKINRLLERIIKLLLKITVLIIYTPVLQVRILWISGISTKVEVWVECLTIKQKWYKIKRKKNLIKQSKRNCIWAKNSGNKCIMKRNKLRLWKLNRLIKIQWVFISNSKKKIRKKLYLKELNLFYIVKEIEFWKLHLQAVCFFQSIEWVLENNENNNNLRNLFRIHIKIEHQFYWRNLLFIPNKTNFLIWAHQVSLNSVNWWLGDFNTDLNWAKIKFKTLYHFCPKSKNTMLFLMKLFFKFWLKSGICW